MVRCTLIVLLGGILGCSRQSSENAELSTPLPIKSKDNLLTDVHHIADNGKIKKVQEKLDRKKLVGEYEWALVGVGESLHLKDTDLSEYAWGGCCTTGDVEAKGMWTIHEQGLTLKVQESSGFKMPNTPLDFVIYKFQNHYLLSLGLRHDEDGLFIDMLLIPSDQQELRFKILQSSKD